MALATVADVRRILRVQPNAERDEQLRAALAAVEAWAEPRLSGIGKEGSQVEVFWDVFEDASLHLPSEDAVVTKVKVYEYPSASGIPLSPIELGFGHGYDLTDTGDVYLRPTLYVSPFEGATVGRRIRTYSRVEVFYEGTGIVTPDVTEGIAYLAAGYWKDGPRALQGLTSEKIGDYSYTLGDLADAAGQPSYVARAMWFLNDHMRKSRIMVI